MVFPRLDRTTLPISSQGYFEFEDVMTLPDTPLPPSLVALQSHGSADSRRGDAARTQDSFYFRSRNQSRSKATATSKSISVKGNIKGVFNALSNLERSVGATSNRREELMRVLEGTFVTNDSFFSNGVDFDEAVDELIAPIIEDIDDDEMSLYSVDSDGEVRGGSEGILVMTKGTTPSATRKSADERGAFVMAPVPLTDPAVALMSLVADVSSRDLLDRSGHSSAPLSIVPSTTQSSEALLDLLGRTDLTVEEKSRRSSLLEESRMSTTTTSTSHRWSGRIELGGLVAARDGRAGERGDSDAKMSLNSMLDMLEVTSHKPPKK